MSLAYIGAALGVWIVVVVFWSRLTFKRHPGGPPVVHGWPFVGSGLAFKNDAKAFVRNCTEKHGPVFDVMLGNRRVTFVADPLLWPDIFKAKQDLNFDRAVDWVRERVLGLHVDRSKKSLREVNPSAFSKPFIAGLQGEGLSEITHDFETQMAREMLMVLKTDKAKVFQKVHMWAFIESAFFNAVTRALFGDVDFDVAAALQDLRTFDDNVVNLVQMPKWHSGVKSGAAARARLWDRLSSVFEDGGEQKSTSTFVKLRSSFLRENGLKEGRDGSLTKAMMGIWWASMGNSNPTGAWVLVYILNHPEAQKALALELEAVVAKARAERRPNLPGFNLPYLTRDDLALCTLMDSCVQETLRFVLAFGSSRQVVNPQGFTLQTVDGNGRSVEYLLPQGTNIQLSAQAHNFDPEVFENPDEWQYDRFAMANHKKFFKRGEEIKQPLIVFGGGVSKCPGRFFALNEMKLAAVYALLCFEFESVPPLPQQSLKRFGLGTLTPDVDPVVGVRFKDGVLAQ